MDERLYTTAEIMLATGLQRGTVTNRAKRLGFERTGFGYTADQVLAIITQPLTSHRKSEAAAMELRERLNGMIRDAGYPMSIVSNKDGAWTIERHKGVTK